MVEALENTFSMFVKPIRRAIRDRGFFEPTEPQVKAIPLIMDGKNVLLIAPTGTGKTEAAFLPLLDFMLRLEKKASIKALYITPLRALNRDLLERLGWWCKRLDIKLAVRHGDTEVRERRAQAKFPPDILITTPETLQAILPGRIMREHLKSIRWVIVDEVHELATEKRGSQLSLGLERLRYITGKDFQLIGLSATIGTPEEVSKFMVGEDRPCEIVQVPVARSIRLKILYPQPSSEDFKLASNLYTYPEVAARLRVMRQLIEDNASVLLFTNTRSEAEILSSRFRVWEEDLPIGVHHGSLSKVSRVATERDLKEGRLLGIVCTSSLELGIDVGSLEMVIQYNSPRQVTRLLQRVGRSGHKIGGIAKGVIITQDSDDALEATVIARRALLEDLEPAPIPEKPLDALTHQIVGLMMHKRSWSFGDVLDIFTRAHPYRNLSEEDLKEVLTYMHTRYPAFARVYFQDRSFTKPQRNKEIYNYYFQNLSMIPDQRQFLVIEEESDEPIGVLDEAFVAENGEIGTKFIVRGSVWKILQVYRNRIYVKSEEDPRGAIPSWVGEEIPVPFEVANEVGEIRRRVEDMFKLGSPPEGIALELSKVYPCEPQTLLRAISEIIEQVQIGLPIPTDKKITIERWGELIILHCCFGLLANRTISRILGLILSEKVGHPIGIQQDPYRIIFQTDKVRSEDVVLMMRDLAHEDIRKVAAQAFIRTGLFKRRFLHVAKKFGAISKDADLSDVSLSNMMKGFEGTVVFDEAIKTTLSNDADIEQTVHILNKIESGDIEVVIIEDESLTPIGRIGIEEIGRMTDLIPPKRMRRILIESARTRLINETRTFVCTDCWGYADVLKVQDLPDSISCPKCGSLKIGLIDETLEKILTLCDKILSNSKLNNKERVLIKRALKSAELISDYGLAAIMVLVVRGMSMSDAKALLIKESKVSDKFIELVLEAERRGLKRRFFVS
ncbi:MAG: DEAD/DEAH box helicase [Candidatus Methylarchaceae archaeon HK02M1]|nr:DEAD/DEAH box helicase [Candidatus Methylarchaceae archaeon HK02M1]